MVALVHIGPRNPNKATKRRSLATFLTSDLIKTVSSTRPHATCRPPIFANSVAINADRAFFLCDITRTFFNPNSGCVRFGVRVAKLRASSPVVSEVGDLWGIKKC